jgi:hypothetical protein
LVILRSAIDDLAIYWRSFNRPIVRIRARVATWTLPRTIGV